MKVPIEREQNDAQCTKYQNNVNKKAPKKSCAKNSLIYLLFAPCVDSSYASHLDRVKQRSGFCSFAHYFLPLHDLHTFQQEPPLTRSANRPDSKCKSTLPGSEGCTAIDAMPADRAPVQLSPRRRATGDNAARALRSRSSTVTPPLAHNASDPSRTLSLAG